jgi:hypothetical protein
LAPAWPRGPAEHITASRAPDGAASRVRRWALVTMTTASGREILIGNRQHRQGASAAAQHPPTRLIREPVHLPGAARRNGTAMNHRSTTEHPAQRLEELISWTGRERLRFLWYRLRLTVSDMNYSVRRMTQLRVRLP